MGLLILKKKNTWNRPPEPRKWNAATEDPGLLDMTLLCLVFRDIPWKWKEPPAQQHSVTSQKTSVFNFTAVKISKNFYQLVNQYDLPQI